MLLFRPVVTEKSLADQDRGKYHFIVDAKANKFQIRQSFVELFGVQPLSVNTLIKKARGKMDWKRRQQIVKGPQKKVVITVAKDAKLTLLNIDTKKKK